MHNIDQKNNFDHIRLFLALGIFFFHTAELTQITALGFLESFIDPAVAVHSFFIVSGFLIFMSYERSSSLKRYFSKRIRRIAPGYITVIILSFLFLSLLSTRTLSDYFSSEESFKYLLANLSTLNFFHLTLPGVFPDNQYTAVNGALWTIKVEIMFYISVPLIVYAYRWLGSTKTLIAIFILSVFYFYSMAYLSNHYHNPLFTMLQHQLPGQMMFFSAGGLLYYHHNKFLKYRHIIFILAILSYALQKFFPCYPLYAISLSIIGIYLATALFYLGHISKYGDLSYGIYIWHFPIIQTFIALHLFDKNPLQAFVFLVTLVLFISWLSWHVIEKPFLSKRSHYVKENS